MIVPDVNVLVYAFRVEAEDHDRYAGWLTDVVAGSDELGLVESAVTGFVRIVTNPRVFADPAPTPEALRFVDALRAAQRARQLSATSATWSRLAAYSHADRQVKGNLIPDAWLAAMARSHGGRLATADRGFARFADLDWFDPVRS